MPGGCGTGGGSGGRASREMRRALPSPTAAGDSSMTPTATVPRRRLGMRLRPHINQIKRNQCTRTRRHKPHQIVSFANAYPYGPCSDSASECARRRRRIRIKSDQINMNMPRTLRARRGRRLHAQREATAAYSKTTQVQRPPRATQAHAHHTKSNEQNSKTKQAKFLPYKYVAAAKPSLWRNLTPKPSKIESKHARSKSLEPISHAAPHLSRMLIQKNQHNQIISN